MYNKGPTLTFNKRQDKFINPSQMFAVHTHVLCKFNQCMDPQTPEEW